MEEQLDNAQKRLAALNQKMPLKGLKVLEIGCGGGYCSYVLAKQYGCEVVGIDIYHNSNWDLFEETNLKFLVCNICEDNILIGEKFDLIVSFVTWEHIKKPFEALVQAKKLLKENGKFYLYAWLYRSPMASHLYRHIFFPYPHLLFDDELVKKYALRLGVEDWWIESFYDCNKLTYAEYKEYFKILNFKIVDEVLKFRNLDVEFYKRFEDKLGLYPVYDLTLDYFAVILENVAGNIEITPCGVDEIKVLKKENDEIVLHLPTVDKSLEFAWDVFCNEKKVKFVKWGCESILRYIPQEKGTYKFKCYIRKTECNKRIVRISQEIEIV